MTLVLLSNTNVDPEGFRGPPSDVVTNPAGTLTTPTQPQLTFAAATR